MFAVWCPRCWRRHMAVWSRLRYIPRRHRWYRQRSTLRVIAPTAPPFCSPLLLNQPPCRRNMAEAAVVVAVVAMAAVARVVGARVAEARVAEVRVAEAVGLAAVVKVVAELEVEREEVALAAANPAAARLVVLPAAADIIIPASIIRMCSRVRSFRNFLPAPLTTSKFFINSPMAPEDSLSSIPMICWAVSRKSRRTKISTTFSVTGPQFPLKEAATA